MKKTMLIVFITMGIIFSGCSDAHVASKNLSYEADMFQLDRRIVFYNGITGEYMLNIEGKCCINADKMDKQLEVVCKVGDEKYKKHFLGLSDNVTYFVEQLEPKGVSTYHYSVVFKPQSIIPDIDFRGSLHDIPKTDTKD